MNIAHLMSQMKGTELEPWLKVLEKQVERGLCNDTYGKLHVWQSTLDEFNTVAAGKIELNASAITVTSNVALSVENQDKLEATFKQLMPWRKGPYQIHGVNIDTEWRSDFKWQRLISSIQPLKGRRILDVGCGNGYHVWRMRGEGAELVIGIDPSPLFVIQFQAINSFIKDEQAYVLPLGIEAVPNNLNAFDTVFSMGVLYHRKSPIDHLYQLRQCLKSGGELVLETLVVPGDEYQVLIPEDRYAQMRNVWFLPSSRAMLMWLQRCGFKNCKLVDESYTSSEEQRSTEWMQFHSLSDFLDADDPSKTIEGYSAPLRAIFTAEAP